MRPKADRRRIALAGVALTAVSFVVFAIVGGGFLDLHVYRVGGYAWLHGIGLYSDEFPRLVPVQPLPFTYPPLAAILFAPSRRCRGRWRSSPSRSSAPPRW